MEKTKFMCVFTLFSGGMLFVLSHACWDGAWERVMSVSNAYAQEQHVDTSVKEVGHRVVTIRKDEGPVPGHMKAPAGTTIVWVNYSRYPVEIYFTRKEVTMACKAPVHFIVDEDGTYVSDKIPFGSVASLCFVEKGNFEYYVRTAAMREFEGQRGMGRTRGTITIE
jgi:hypothetical protein